MRLEHPPARPGRGGPVAPARPARARQPRARRGGRRARPRPPSATRDGTDAHIETDEGAGRAARPGDAHPGRPADLPRRRRGHLDRPAHREGATTPGPRATARTTAVRARPDRRPARPPARAPAPAPTAGSGVLAVGEHRPRHDQRQRRPPAVRREDDEPDDRRPPGASWLRLAAWSRPASWSCSPRDRLQPRPRQDAARRRTRRTTRHPARTPTSASDGPSRTPITGVTARDFDPQGTDGSENPDEAPLRRRRQPGDRLADLALRPAARPGRPEDRRRPGARPPTAATT